VPIVVLTGIEKKGLGVEAVKAGAEDYLAKSWLEPNLLVRTIRHAIERFGHRRADEKFRESEARYRTLFEQSPDGVLLIDPETLAAAEFNDAACRQLEYSREEFARVSVFDYEARERPEETRAHAAQIVRARRADFETQHRTKSGKVRDVLVTIQAVQLSGRCLLHSIHHDITELKRSERAAYEQELAEQRLRDEQQRYQRLLTSVTSYTYTVKMAAGRPVATEHGPGCMAVTGYAPEDFAANPYLWINMVHPDDQEAVRQHVSRVTAAGEVPPLEHRIFHHDGSVRWLRNTMLTCRDENGHLLRYDGVVEDITARKSAERQLYEHEAQMLAARQIQQHLLPGRPPTVPGFDIAGASYPAEYTAGDYYDFVTMCDGSLACVIADVAGHKFGSALLMASTEAYLRSLCRMHSSVMEILGLLNTSLIAEVEEDYFVTLLLARLNPAKRSLMHASAGHQTSYVLDASGAVKHRLESTGLPLGVLPDVEYETAGPFLLVPGDLVLLLTDGVHEAVSAQEGAFGTERTLSVVRENRDRPAAEIVEQLHEAVRKFCLPQRPLDDVTVVVIKVQS
jgi:PAS domain S-box-containing protein